jgi:thymidylate kinase
MARLSAQSAAGRMEAQKVDKAPAVHGSEVPVALERGVLITVSGMDGSGKSSSTQAVAAQLEAAGLPVEVAWSRLGGDREILDKIAGPARRLLRQRGTLADPAFGKEGRHGDGGPPAEAERTEAPPPAGRSLKSRVVKWIWVLVVALAKVRTARKTAAARSRGSSVVCDRWLADALIDMRLYYHRRYRLAEIVLRVGMPVPELGVLLEVDAETAARRKPGDQAQHVFAEMERLYGGIGRRCGLVSVDASASQEEVQAVLARLVDGLIAARAAQSTPS